MTDTAKMMVYDAKKKSAGVAYLLWFLLGGLGAHRFYTGRAGTGAVYVALQVIGWLTLAAGLGAFLLIAVALWWAVDAFLLPGMVRQNNLMLAAQITASTMSLPA